MIYDKLHFKDLYFLIIELILFLNKRKNRRKTFIK
jgi:hypothetical protein